MKAQLENARELARRISQLGARDPALEPLLEEYATAIDALVNSPGLPDAPRELLEDLNQLHAGVMATVEALKEQTKGEMRDAHQKGKAIMTYANRLPKTISSRKRKI